MKWTWFFVLIFCLVLETGFNVFFNKILSQGANSAGLFITSLIFGVSIIIGCYNRKMGISVKKVNPYWVRPIVLLVSFGLMIVFCLNLSSAFDAIPINPKVSDIIPIIKIAVQRLISGHYAYAQINFANYSMPLTYLPAQWLPFYIPEILRFDYRWLALGINLSVGLWLIARAMRGGYRGGLIVLGLLLLNYTMIRRFNDGILATTIEIMIAGYYMAFIISLNQRNAVLKGVLIAVCLLSRYSLVLWLPLWLMVEFLSKDRIKLATSVLVIFSAIVLLYIIPFLSHDWHIFSNAYHYYTQATVDEWQRKDAHGVPVHLYNGMGFAWLFYEKLSDYPIAARVQILKTVHLVVCCTITIMLGVWYFFNRNRLNPRIFLMASFKIYLTFFLAFLQLPYAYLMITGTFVSIAILAELLRYEVVKIPTSTH